MQTRCINQSQKLYFIPKAPNVWAELKDIGSAIFNALLNRGNHGCCKDVQDLNDHLLRDIGMTDSGGNRSNEHYLRQKFGHPYL